MFRYVCVVGMTSSYQPIVAHSLLPRIVLLLFCFAFWRILPLAHCTILPSCKMSGCCVSSSLFATLSRYFTLFFTCVSAVSLGISVIALPPSTSGFLARCIFMAQSIVLLQCAILHNKLVSESLQSTFELLTILLYSNCREFCRCIQFCWQESSRSHNIMNMNFLAKFAV